MKHCSLLILFSLFLFGQGLAQDPKSELQQFVRTEFVSGNHTLKVVKNQWEKPDMEIPTDYNGKILDPKVWSEAKLKTPDVETKITGTVKLKFEYSDNSLLIYPTGNSILPEIEIELESSIARINGYELDNAKEMDIKDSKNLFGSPWSGFQWKLNQPSNHREKGPKLTLGKIKGNGDKYIEVIWFKNDVKRHYRLIG
ncbi:MAG: hypothetical protein AAF039_17795 [Bacteroidota bacterium]